MYKYLISLIVLYISLNIRGNKNDSSYLNYLENYSKSLLVKNTDSANIVLNEGIKLAKKLNNRHIEASMLYKKAVIYKFEKRSLNALDFMNQSLKIFEEIKEDRGVAMVNLGIGTIYSEINEYDKAISKYQTALNYYLKHNKKQNISVCYNNIAYIYQRQQMFNKALIYYTKIQELDTNNKEVTASSNISIAKTYTSLYKNSIHREYTYKSKILDSAMYHYNQGIEMLKLLNNSYKLHQAYVHKASFLNFNQKYHQAIDLLYKAKTGYDISDKNDIELLYRINHELSNSYHNLLQYDSACKYMVLSRELKDEIDIKQNKIELTKKVYQQQYNLEKKIIEAQHRVEKTKLNAQHKISLILFSSIIFIFILIGIISYQKLKSKEKESFIKGNYSGEEKERKRIAMELHDNLGQQLSVIKKNKIITNDVNLNNLLSQSISTVKRLSKKIYPTQIDFIGLESSIKQLCIDTEKNCDIDVSYDFNLDTEQKKLNHEEKIHLYRVIQESFNNSIKHSQCSNIRITCNTYNNNIKISYYDNGIGLDKNNQLGLGLKNIKNRIDILKGKWIVKQQKKGINYTFIIPY